MINTLAYPDVVGATSVDQSARLATAALDRSPTQDSKTQSSGELKHQTLELLSTYRQSGRAALREQIIRLNLGLARKEAHYWASQCLESYEDLLQVGSIGLIAAIDKFDLSKGYAFSTFAMPYIRGEIQHYLRDKSSIVRVPRRWSELLHKANIVSQNFQIQHRRLPTDVEIAQALEISPAEWHEVRIAKQNRQPVSLDCPVGNEEECCMLDILPDQQFRSFQLPEDDQHRLKQGLVTLEQHTRQIIEFVFFYDLTQKQVAEKMNISVITVSRHVKKGVGLLQSFFNENNENN
jgi:RNA polymerase sigma-B factor